MKPRSRTARFPLGFLLGCAFACETEPSDTGVPSTEPADLQVGLRHYDGEATVATEEPASYVGWESFHFTDERGLGDDLCHIRYDLGSLAVRSDCDDCLWAFDLEASDATVVPKGDTGCQELGIEAADFDGALYSYGYAERSGPYEHVLMYEVAGYGWYPVTWASWEEPSFSYDWAMDYYYF